MSEPRETARQIAEQIADAVYARNPSASGLDIAETVEPILASLTADLAQARQENRIRSGQITELWRLLDVAKTELAAAEQARDEARKALDKKLQDYNILVKTNRHAARTALLEAAEDEKAMTELVEALTKIVDWESVNAAATFSEAAWTHIEAWLTTRAGGPRSTPESLGSHRLEHD